MKNHKKMGVKAWKIVGLFLIALVTAIFHLKLGHVIYWNVLKFQVLFRESDQIPRKYYCNLFSGKWVYDNKSYPSYKEKDCSFIEDGFACEKYGRYNLKYQNWRWQPHHCDLPRFNGRAFMEKIRGKKVVYVGDSLNRNQWESMLCLIQSTLLPISSKKSLLSKGGNFYIFQDIEYNATISFYWSPLLVESNCDDMASNRVNDRVVRIKAIEKHARHWTDADILIFDSFLWWLEPTITILWGSFGSSDAIYKKTTLNMRRYEIALNTWSNWLEINVNRTKTKLYFMSLSPMHCRPPHVRRGEILGLEQQHCYNQTEPISKEGYWGCPSNRGMMNIAESMIDKLQRRGLKVQYLNITQLSGYRKDAHPSIYKKFRHQISEDKLKNPESYSDCIHWCLPGVPDVWNQILYAYIMNPDKYY